jgi:crotonobetainyl-CoA:carnitine CoA-transferase CaiB-like acyl-CoA transferase
VAPSNDAFVVRFLNCIGLGHLLEQPDYATNERRMRNRPALNAAINETMEKQTVDHWIAAINKAGCPCGRVMNLEEVFSDPQVLSQDLVLDVEQPDGSTIRMTGFPVKLSDTPARLRRPVPALGADTEAVLASLRPVPEDRGDSA